MTTDLILGTAGHIDHGKTSLIRALTGVDPDRLPEEKKRGITIELGFAELVLGEYRLGIVDVPGHERFVRNMLCGATGMDLALLVIAADDSIKQQTREHLDILRLLELEAGVIAVTKVDLVDEGWLDLVDEEIRDLCADTFLADAPLVHTSVMSGRGLDDLKQALSDAAQRVAEGGRAQRIRGPFRMAIDRTFTIAGHGTVVTGSVGSGECRLGDELVIEPGGLRVRIRGLQNHDRSVEAVHRGQRAAINLVGVHHDEIGRGQELATAGHLQPSRLITGSIAVLDSSPRPLKDRGRIKLHLGTAELTASVRLLAQTELKPGESGLAQFFLNAPVVSVWNQPFVIRAESPAATIGGGRVLQPDAERIRRADDETLQMIGRLASSDPLERGSAALYGLGLREWQPEDLARLAGIDDGPRVVSQLIERGDIREVSASPTRKLRLHRLVLARLYHRIEVALKKLHDLHPLKLAHDRATLIAGFRYVGEESVLDAALRDLAASGRVRISPRGIALANCGPKLSANEQKLMGQLIDQIRAGGMQPPSAKECQQQAQKNQQSVPQLLSLAAANGDLVEVAEDLYFHATVEQQARDTLAQRLSNGSGVTVSEIRELLNTSRKYAVPYCEYLDRIGFTERQGDVRVLRRPGA